MDQLIPVVGTTALLGSALVGGIFFAFSSFIMKALAGVPSEEGIGAMQSINVFENTLLTETVFANTDLTGATGLDTCRYVGPSTLDHRTLARNPHLPSEFLRGCGLSDHEIEFAKLYRPGLTNEEITTIGYRIIELRTDPAIQF